MNIQKLFRITNFRNVIKKADIAVFLREGEKIKSMPTELLEQLKRKDLLPIVRLLSPEKDVLPVNRIIRDIDIQALENGADPILVLGKIAENRASDENDFYSVSLLKLLKTVGLSVPEEIEINNPENVFELIKALEYPLGAVFLWVIDSETHQTLREILSPLDYSRVYRRGDPEIKEKMSGSFSTLTEKWKEHFSSFDEIAKLSLAGFFKNNDEDFYRSYILAWLKGEKGGN